jgi:hypothetical protein
MIESPLTEEEYQELKKFKPYERTRATDDPDINDKINGILILFARRYVMREGWIDLITTRDAAKEIKELIKECGGKV